MRCFGYMTSEFDNILCRRLLSVIQDLRCYFIKFNKSSAELAMQRTLHHALLHYQDEGELEPYIKKLARTIMKNNSKDVPSDLMEAVLMDEGEDVAVTVLDKVLEEGFVTRVHSMVVAHMHYFLLLCESYKKQNSLTSYFPSEFKQECNRLIKADSNFIPLCLSTYDQYGDDIRKFLSYEELPKTWKEADYSSIDLYTSKRVKFVDKLGVVIDVNSMKSDLDQLYASNELYLVGKFSGKRIVRVKYDEEWDKMCELIDAPENNEMKYTLGEITIVRTLGGSPSVLNPVLDNEYELCLDEILANLISATKGRYLGRGIEYMYFLVDEVMNLEPKLAMGKELVFKEEDITNSIQLYSR